ncbi:MAG: hypothetical protein WCJ29_01530 [bacterium]
MSEAPFGGLPIEPSGARCIGMTIEEIALEVLMDEPELQEKARAFFRAKQESLSLIMTSKAVQRLSGLRIYGIKYDPRLNLNVSIHDDMRRIKETPCAQSRLFFIRFIAGHFVALGIRIGLLENVLMTGLIGVILHDIGQPAFCPDGDALLVELGHDHHDKRSARLIAEDSEVMLAIRRADVEVEDVIQMIRGKGELSVLRGISILIGSVVLDGEITGYGPGMEFSRKVRKTIHGFEKKHLKVSDQVHLSQLLSHRTELLRKVYCHPYNLVASSAFRYVVKHLVSEHKFPIRLIEYGSDAEAEAGIAGTMKSIQGVVQDWIVSAHKLGLGNLYEIQRWKMQKFFTHDKHRAFLVHADQGVAARTFSLSPVDFTGRVIDVELPDGRRKALRADSDSLPEDDRFYHTLTWKMS